MPPPPRFSPPPEPVGSVRLGWGTVRLVIARCSVDYVGRLTAHLPMAPRLILIKADNSVSIHADDRAFKPLNWMTPPCKLREEPVDDEDMLARWTVTHGKS